MISMSRLDAVTSTAALAAAAAAAATLTAAPAWAHVHVDADTTTAGQYAILSFEVPNESGSGAATTELRVALPDLTSVRTETMPGWTARLDRNTAAGTISAITWTAARQPDGDTAPVGPSSGSSPGG